MEPVEEHKKFIEKLAADTPGLGSRLVREKGIFSKARGDERFNACVLRLSQEDRSLLAEMLQDERKTAFFDVLVHLHEACVLGGWKITKNGVEIPAEPFGYTMAEEYLALLEDGDWSSIEE